MSYVEIKGLKEGKEASFKFNQTDTKVYLKGLAQVNIEPIKNMPNLEEVNFDHCEFTSLDLTPLSEVKKLKKLIINSFKLTSIDLAPLKGSPLEELTIYGDDLSAIDLDPVKSCDLKKMYLFLEKAKRVELSSLLYFNNLIILHLNLKNVEDIDLTLLIKAPSLEHLTLKLPLVSKIDLNLIANCLNLKSFELTSKPGMLDFRPMINLKNILGLDLDFGDQIPQKHGIDFTPLHELNSLKTMTLEGQIFRDVDLSKVINFTNLMSLYIHYTGIQELDMSSFPVNSKLTSIALDNNSLKTFDLSFMRRENQIEEIRLNNNNIEKIDLTPLRDCTHLKEIDLSWNNLRDIDLSPLRNDVAIELSHNEVFAKRGVRERSSDGVKSSEILKDKNVTGFFLLGLVLLFFGLITPVTWMNIAISLTGGGIICIFGAYFFYRQKLGIGSTSPVKSSPTVPTINVPANIPNPTNTLDSTVRPRSKYCVNCGQKIDITIKYCPNCGVKISE